MSFRLGLAQVGYPSDGDVPVQVEQAAAAAERAGVQLLAFPENLMSPRQLDAAELRKLAEPLDGPFAQTVAETASRHRLWICFTMSETNPAGGPPFNSAVVVDDTGKQQGVYRKCHLYDAHGVYESDRMTAGDALAQPVQTPFCKLGLSICYDLRFPEVARLLALAGCDLILYPAAWHAGPHKEGHWQTLLSARAIENECFVAGICHAGEGFVEQSMVVSPLGEVLATAQDLHGSEVLVVADIDRDAVARTRENMPVFEHRRPELY